MTATIRSTAARAPATLVSVLTTGRGRRLIDRIRAILGYSDIAGFGKALRGYRETIPLRCRRTIPFGAQGQWWRCDFYPVPKGRGPDERTMS